MTNATLLGNKYTEQEVFQVPAVPFTSTFSPVHHREVITAVKSAIQTVGMNIVSAEYALGRNGNQMFGVFDLNNGNNAMGWALGVRNSMDKSLALGLTCGTRVFICSNLAFDGEFVEFRRHTSRLDYDELEYLAYRSVRKMMTRLAAFQAWHEGLRRYPLTERDAKVLIVELMTNLVIPPSRLNQFADLYFGGTYGRDLYGFHETATDLLRGTNLLTLPRKNQQLNQVIARYIEQDEADALSTLGDFYQQRHLLPRL
jgi:hypothetical protein